jgi:hypothetical protein
MHPTDGEILQPHKQDAWSFGITLLQLALLRIDLEGKINSLHQISMMRTHFSLI